MLRATLLIGLVIPTLAYAQPRASNVPPLPQQERFVPRGGLSVTLRVSPNRLQVDEIPTFTVVVRNIGATRVLVLPDVASNIRIFDREGRFVPARRGGIADYVARSIRVRDLIALEPGATHNFKVLPEYHNPNDFGGTGMYSRSWGDRGIGLGLTPGMYSVRFGYYALQDYGATSYAEAMPATLWEGSIETAPAPLTVLPLDGARLAKAIADIDGSAPAETLAEFSQVARSPQTIDAWLRRFERNAAERRTVVSVILAIGDSGGISRVLELVAALPERERQTLMATSGVLIGLQAPGCLSVPWLLQSLNNSLDNLTGIENTYRTIAARCPELLSEVRAIVQSPVQVRNGASDAYARAKYLEVLGWIGDRSDVPMLLAILKGDSPATRPSANDAGTLRRGALRGLSRFGGEDTAQAILDRLRLVRTDRSSAIDLLMIAARLPLPEATPILIDVLKSQDREVVTYAVQALQRRGDREAIPALEGLLKHTDQNVRQSAAFALQNAGDAISLSLMRTLVADRDPAVRMMALSHLARRGDASDVPTFVEHLATQTREPAIQGIQRLGTAATFLPLKARLNTTDPELRRLVMSALQSLTFAAIWRDASEWDIWWARHSSSSRADWAREALADVGNRGSTYSAQAALEFLSRTGDLTPELLAAATVSPTVLVRLTAARIVGESDHRRAVLLIARELESRSVFWCGRAVIEFNTLMARNEQLDCTNLGGRAAARERWTALARD